MKNPLSLENGGINFFLECSEIFVNFSKTY